MLPINIMLCIINIFTVTCLDPDKVKKLKEKLLSQNYKEMLGHNFSLSSKEKIVNAAIMKEKFAIIDEGLSDSKKFIYSKRFPSFKEEMRNTKLYKIIKDMPKGAFLHTHRNGIVGPDYILNVTYLPDLFVCFEEDFPKFRFSANTPNRTCNSEWKLMKDVRNSSKNVTEFDETLRKRFVFDVDGKYMDIDEVWRKFEKIFFVFSPLLKYKPVAEQLLYSIFEACRNDNIMYTEIRYSFDSWYDLNGQIYNITEVGRMTKNIIDKFQIDHPDFYGAKFIYATKKFVDKKELHNKLEMAKNMKNTFPDLVAGFDLVGQEDRGNLLKVYLDELAQAADDLDYFFHAGETKWYGCKSDENLYDAVALNTRRIGHGYALIKHPVLMREVKKRGIAIEVNLLSNQILALVDDIRNHPLATMMAVNMPVVLSSDDPGIWDAAVLSDDFFVAFVVVAHRNADLRTLKQLAINSIKYSVANNKDKLLIAFLKQWEQFINNYNQKKCEKHR